MYGHNAEINTVTFSKKGDFFATGGADSNIFIWKSAFCKPNGQEIKSQGVCESGHRKDPRTLTTTTFGVNGNKKGKFTSGSCC